CFSKAAVAVAPFGPSDAKARRRGADYAGYVNTNLLLADQCEWIVGSCIVVERQRSLVSHKVIGAQPVLPDDDRVFRNGADLLDEACQMKRDLRVGRGVANIGGCHRLRFTQFVDLDHPGNDRSARALPDDPGGQTSGKT